MHHPIGMQDFDNAFGFWAAMFTATKELMTATQEYTRLATLHWWSAWTTPWPRTWTETPEPATLAAPPPATLAAPEPATDESARARPRRQTPAARALDRNAVSPRKRANRSGRKLTRTRKRQAHK
jgi:hypothetical protein